MNNDSKNENILRKILKLLEIDIVRKIVGVVIVISCMIMFVARITK